MVLSRGSTDGVEILLRKSHVDELRELATTPGLRLRAPLRKRLESTQSPRDRSTISARDRRGLSALERSGDFVPVVVTASEIACALDASCTTRSASLMRIAAACEQAWLQKERSSALDSGPVPSRRLPNAVRVTSVVRGGTPE